MCRRKRPAYECAERLRADLRPELCHGNGYAAFVPVRVILPVDVLVTLRQLRRSRSEGRSYIHYRDACLAQAALELSEQDVALCRWTRPREQWCAHGQLVAPTRHAGRGGWRKLLQVRFMEFVDERASPQFQPAGQLTHALEVQRYEAAGIVDGTREQCRELHGE